jgi:peptidoglycan/xylan/chitin deacetylase (PgdA/CDA1 family)
MSIDNEAHEESIDEAERAALHEVELGIEHLQRAHGHLVSFHHAVGRGMDHLATAEVKLRAEGYEDLANAIRDEYLPRGVIESQHPDDHARWSYDVLETYEEAFLNDIVAFGKEATDRVTDGLRHPAERAQEREWRRRSRRE